MLSVAAIPVPDITASPSPVPASCPLLVQVAVSVAAALATLSLDQLNTSVQLASVALAATAAWTALANVRDEERLNARTETLGWLLHGG